MIDWKFVADKTLAAIYLTDKDGKILYVNEIVEKATKYSREELYSLPSVFELAHPEDRDEMRRAHKKVFDKGRTFYETRYLTKSGEVRWAWGFITPIKIGDESYILGNWIDVTRTKEYEEKIKESEQFWRSLVDEGLAPIYIIQDGIIVYANKTTEKVTGYKEEEIIGKNFESLIYPDDLKLSPLQKQDCSFRIVTKYGTKWVTARCSEITYKGKPAKILVSLDTTEIYNLREKLQQSYSYLKLLNKILRHDIANALTVIVLALEEKDCKLLDKALEKAEYIKSLINDVRELETAVEELKAVRLDEYAKDVAKSYGVDVKAEPVTVLANEGLKSLINNLIHNAVTHGKVGVEVEVLRTDKWGILRVKDKGDGVPVELRDKIFEEGFTTKKGSGLGLYIVKKLLEIYGGEIEVYDNAPHGAVFEVRLRRTEDKI
ncbi:MAG: PAS domain-containing sensor histidine kinase [Archaeoglobaceae archaeon]|nr:PAS domain-containing sensor histidine kinase [Archaeoglobaceae archaeon]MCX8151639.1 PAS domain-containing sensor histidine kinase [Archaeoglobaceae archaeon]MDW8013083.1 PAS domain-containing sensor histidine kinase [Archaeoglobaceae archaeon]